MNMKKMLLSAAAAAVVATPLLAMPAAAQNEQFMPLLVYRTGPYAPSGIPLANGFVDYFELINARDGGINGVKVTWEECETSYNTDRGVECYERLKKNGPTGASLVNPYSTGITYALIERATADKIPVFSMGYGRADATIGSVFPYVFTAPATYWAGADAIVQYIQAQEKGSLKGKKIALVYHDSAYGKEPISTLQALAKQEGYTLNLFPVAHPGLEQKATWLQIGRQLRPDWVIMWGWGVMNSTAIKEAAAVGYPMNKFVGVWWSGSEADVRPAGAAAKGYMSASFTGVGTGAKVHSEIRDIVFAKGKGIGKDTFGEALYNRGVVNAAIMIEAVRTAQGKFGNKPLTGEQVQWGFENLNITQEVIDKLGLTGLMSPIKLSCNDHEGGGSVVIQQWDGKQWNFVSDFIKPRREMLTKMYEASAMQYAKEKGITPRDCKM